MAPDFHSQVLQPSFCAVKSLHYLRVSQSVTADSTPCENTWFRSTRAEPRGSGQHVQSHVVPVNTCRATWFRSTRAEPRGSGQHMQSHVVPVNTCRATWFRSARAQSRGLGQGQTQISCPVVFCFHSRGHQESQHGLVTQSRRLRH